MAHRAGYGRSLSGRGTSRTRRTRRGDQLEEDEIPEVYREMLSEAEARETAHQLENGERPWKRRRVGERVSIPPRPAHQEESQSSPMSSGIGERQPQMAYNSATSSDESDPEWEEVDIQHGSDMLQTAPSASGDDETLQITLGQRDVSKKKALPKRRLVSAAQRKLRLDVHKVHLLCLLGHVHLRNTYCNDGAVQASIKRILSKEIIALLNPPDDKDQFTRSTMFVDGLNQAGAIFNRKFTVTKPGLERPHWANDPRSLDLKVQSIISKSEVILSRGDFVDQTKSRRGSRDLGAQLFCALLRSAGVETRLVCSLQPLPFSGTVRDDSPAPSVEPKSIAISSDDHGSSADEKTRPSSSASATPPMRHRRLGQPRFKALRRSQTTSKSGKFIVSHAIGCVSFQRH